MQSRPPIVTVPAAQSLGLGWGLVWLVVGLGLGWDGAWLGYGLGYGPGRATAQEGDKGVGMDLGLG